LTGSDIDLKVKGVRASGRNMRITITLRQERRENIERETPGWEPWKCNRNKTRHTYVVIFLSWPKYIYRAYFIL
jgi:hypothetical protein